ncbi:GlcNAc-transferase family protein [Stenotrophomonas sp.]|uniref:GlcNAc-transferase family protein n=1 Tax=Stenotrophomonas sp. TaxID=69392 RepID=UPI002D45B804|nr:GlcNAc-transferase family protein [Stenotrophomonas sp.]HYQ25373.1 GlcNAc-transferase family protein [Stenotrophomonas sp.]
MNRGKSIFVQIPSYRDPQLLPTLLDMIETASFPGLLHISICWQHGTEEGTPGLASVGLEYRETEEGGIYPVHIYHKNGATIDVIDVHYSHSKGCGWARHLAQSRYRGETYNLQIDSHHRFSDQWDVKMGDLLELLRPRTPKPLITGHPPDFNPATYPLDRQEYTSGIVFDCFSPTGVVKLRSIRLPPRPEGSAAFRAKFIAGGFIFSDGTFVSDVMSDPDQFFCTEEISLSLRAFTHGYEFFHPYETMLWHQYHNLAQKVWDDHSEAQVSEGALEKSARSRSLAALQKTLTLLEISLDPTPNDPGKFGLGSIRTLPEYERYVGLSFRNRAVQPDSLTPHEPDSSLSLLDRTDWELRLIYFRTVRISVHLASDHHRHPTSVLVSCHAADGSVHSMRELSIQELKTLSADGHLQYDQDLRLWRHQLPISYAIHARSSESASDPHLSISAEEIAA